MRVIISMRGGGVGGGSVATLNPPRALLTAGQHGAFFCLLAVEVGGILVVRGVVRF